MIILLNKKSFKKYGCKMFLFPVLNLPVEYETVVLNYVEEIADHLVLNLLLENVSLYTSK